MKQFGSDEIARFLRAADKQMSKRFDVVIIGGAAAALSFGAESSTLDVDTATSVAPIEGAFEKARKETGLEIPIGRTPVFEAPYEYESRLKRLARRGLKKLRIFVPDKHDWAFMKIVRLYDKDIEDIKEVAAKIGFDKDLFLKRFIDEMTHIEPAKRLVQYFVAMMEELYGKDEADKMEAAIRKKWKIA